MAAALAVLVLLSGLTAPGDKAYATTVTFTAGELLGKPTNNSIAINVVPAAAIQYYYKYGTSSGDLTQQTSPVDATGGQPSEVTLTGLTANTKYYYQMIYDGDASVTDGDFETRTERSFWTQRAPGSTFKFTIISDSHANYSNTQTQQAAANIITDQPDFHLDLGDTFMTDGDTNQSLVDAEYLAQRGPLFMGGIGQSSPIFLASGNHENEEGWNLDDTFSIARASIQARKLYFPTPIDEGPGGFYSGNTDTLAAINATTYGDQYREDYYAWTWGDALFIVFDPFQYTMANPYGASAGEGGDDPASGDRWNWTLGQEQYNWLKQTLENSNAKYKFMFAHHMLGGTQNYVRGGAVPAHMFEWGGYNADGTTWGWNTKRPGWGDDPIRQLMIDNGVSAFFHGHDHQYAYEVRDGIVYQSTPQPNSTLNFNYYNESDPYTERVLPNPGHLRVTVTPSQATVEYITSSGSSGAVQHSYAILPRTTEPTHNLTMAASPVGGGTTIPAVGIHTYAEGTVVNLTATPAAGYVFSSWSAGVADPSSASTTVTMSADKTVTATFTPITHNLTMAASPVGGGTTIPAVGIHTYAEGTVVNLTATPAAGYVFSSWSAGVADPSSASTTVTMSADKTVTATFTPITHNLTMAASPVGGGTTSPAVGIHTYAEGTVVNLTATPAAGYVFSSWSAGVADPSSASTTVTMSADKTVTATFTPITHNLTMAASPVGGGTTSPAVGIHTYAEGTVVNLTATPAAGYVFSSWSAGVADPSSASTTVTMSADKTVTATFTPITHNLTMAASPVGGGTTSPAVGIHTYAEGTVVNLTATPAAGYVFSSWSAGVADPSSASTTVTMSADKTVTATFTPITHNLTMAASPVGGGTTIPAVGIHTYAEGTVVNLTATPAAGYVFSSWSAGVADPSSASTTVTMSADKTVTATFTAQTYALPLQPGWNLVAAAPGTTFPSGLFGWDGSAYQSTASVVAWQGYWCKVSQQSSLIVTGVAGPRTIALTTGWNLIGNSMNSAAALGLPNGVTAFVYDTGAQSYSSVLSLLPGQGAWVNGTSGGSVTLAPAGS